MKTICGVCVCVLSGGGGGGGVDSIRQTSNSFVLKGQYHGRYHDFG